MKKYNKNIVDTIILLPIIWIFSGFLIFNGGDKNIVALIIVSIIVSIIYYKKETIKKDHNYTYFLTLFTSALVGSVYYITIGFGSGEVRSYIAISLYLLVLPRRLINSEQLKWMVFLGACVSVALLTYNRYELNIVRGVNSFNPIPYSIALSVYAITALYLFLFKKSKISIISFALLLVGIFITETRGAIFPVISVSIMMCCLTLFRIQRIKNKHLFFAIIPISLAILSSLNVLSDRIEDTKVEIERITSGDMNSSIGFRLQFWAAAQQLYIKSPIYGLGDSHKENLQKLYKEGKVSNSIARYSPTHYHNQYIDKLVKNGAIGFLLLLIIQLIPCIIASKKKLPSRYLTYSLTTLVVLSGLTDTPMSQPFSLIPILIVTYLSLNLDSLSLTNGIEMKPDKH
ncbi:O-antigen ligase family protein [Vibrio sp. F13]|uniref:O-antigen ligase family protein n=1 Tax=Vibrio sp. F13 TaxID=2070777 RepID=UPI0010BD2256|nr:O-antigen ligase family protein [Vibrio sp. F13]TKF74753.1 O-antigen ligase family protein [Vibrio sp. F13]